MRVCRASDGGLSRRAACRHCDVRGSFAVYLADPVSPTGSAKPARQGRPRWRQAGAASGGLARSGQPRTGHHDGGTGRQNAGQEDYSGSSGFAVASATEGRSSFIALYWPRKSNARMCARRGTYGMLIASRARAKQHTDRFSSMKQTRRPSCPGDKAGPAVAAPGSMPMHRSDTGQPRSRLPGCVALFDRTLDDRPSREPRDPRRLRPDQLAPPRWQRDVVILDSLSSHKAPRPRQSPGNAAPGSSSGHSIVQATIRSKWPSLSSKPNIDASTPGPSTRTAEASAISANRIPRRSGATTAWTLDAHRIGSASKVRCSKEPADRTAARIVASRTRRSRPGCRWASGGGS